MQVAAKAYRCCGDIDRDERLEEPAYGAEHTGHELLGPTVAYVIGPAVLAAVHADELGVLGALHLLDDALGLLRPLIGPFRIARPHA